MKVLVFGRSGQVGRELILRAPSSVSIQALGRADADLSDPDACAEAIRSARPDAVVNAAAWTSVDAAERNEPAARVINGEAPAAMARAAAAAGIPLLHLSSDYVFDGAGVAPFAPDHRTGPLNAYGRSKELGERSVREAGGRHLILRTSWVFAAHGANFVRTMIDLGRRHKEVRVVIDQIGGPTPASAIADACLSLVQALAAGADGGTYHLSGFPDTTWADFAREVLSAANSTCRVVPITSAERPTFARRPANSRLDCTSLAKDFGLDRPLWREALTHVVGEAGEVADGR